MASSSEVYDTSRLITVTDIENVLTDISTFTSVRIATKGNRDRRNKLVYLKDVGFTPDLKHIIIDLSSLRERFWEIDGDNTLVQFGEGDWVKFRYIIREGMREWMTGIYCILHREKIYIPEWFRNKYTYNCRFKLEDLPEKSNTPNMGDVPFQKALHNYCGFGRIRVERGLDRESELTEILGDQDGDYYIIIDGLLAKSKKQEMYMYIREDPDKPHPGLPSEKEGYGWVKCNEPNSAKLQRIRKKLKGKLNTVRAYQQELEEYREYEGELYCNYDVGTSDPDVVEVEVCTGYCNNDICPKRFFQQKVRWRIEDAAITRFTNHETSEIREWWFQQERIKNAEELESLVEEQKLYISQRG